MDNLNGNKFNNKEALAYLKLYQSGDKEARSKLIIRSIPYIKFYVLKYYSYAISESRTVEDLIEMGIFGVMEAIDKFDFSRGTNFFHYATYYIEKEVLKFIKSENKKVKFVSYDKMVEDLNSQGLGIISSFNLENIYFEKEIMETMRCLIEGLNVDVQNIIKDYFGIDRPKIRLIDIAIKYNISSAKASKVIVTNLYRLRLQLNRKEYYGAVK